MSEALVESQVRPDNRLLLAILIAAAVHAMVVLGVRWPPQAPVKSRFAAMEVVLVPASAPVDTTSAVLPATPETPASDMDEPPLLPMPAVEKPQIKAAPSPSVAPPKPPAPARVTAKPSAKPMAEPAAPKVVTPEPAASDSGAPPAVHESAPLPLPSAAQLIERSLAMAATGAGLLEEKTVSGQSLSERTLYIKNNTRDWNEIAYSEALRRKAKHFGELLERDSPPGRVGLDVAVASDGSLVSVTITRSSGIEATDAKAVHIIEKAAPYAQLPPEMAKKYDVAHVEFTMNITQDEGFSSGQ
jgi:protein TonB